MTESKTCWQINPLIVFREEFDGAAILFDPATRKAYALDEVPTFIWKHLNGQNTTNDMVALLHRECGQLPENAEADVLAFIADLSSEGFIGQETPLPNVTSLGACATGQGK